MGTPHRYLSSPPYKCVTLQNYAQQITFSSVSLKIRVNRPIMNLMVKTLSAFVCWFFTINQFLGELYAFLIYDILYTQNLLKN